MSDYCDSCGTPLWCLPEEYFRHTFQLPMLKEDSKSSKIKTTQQFLFFFFLSHSTGAKNLQDNLGQLWELSFLFVLRGH